MGIVTGAVRSAWARRNMARVLIREHANAAASVRRILVLLPVALGATAGGCTGTVTVEATDLSAVQPGAERETVEQVVGEPGKFYVSRGLAYASYRYDMGGSREYHLFNDNEVGLAIVTLPLYPIIIPVGHAIIRPLEHLRLRVEQRAWLCVTYGGDRIATGVTAPVTVPCEPPGGLWGDKGGNATASSQPTHIVDPEAKARVVAYLDRNMRDFENAMRDYDARNPDSLVPRDARITGNTVFSYDVREANEDRVVLRVVFGNGGRVATKLLLVSWVDGDLEVVAHRDDAQGKKAGSS